MYFLKNERDLFCLNLQAIKGNARLNKIEYTLALLLFIFYTLYIMGYLLAALSEGIIRLEFQSFDLFIISDLRITEYEYVNDTLRMYKNDDIRMYNFNCITDTIVEVITTCNTYTLLTVHLL